MQKLSDYARPTEANLEMAQELDQSPIEDILGLIHRQDGVAHEAVGECLSSMAEAVEVLVTSLSGGGNWFNVGAGTSGRLGVLDASEVPPTYGMSPRRVQALMAGGERALRNAVEGAEDDFEAAGFELQQRGLGLGDVVVGISASGGTPYVLGGLEFAHKNGARTIGITSDSNSELATSAEISIVPNVGPEVVSGSTRMKCGLAQKMILTAISTTVMVKLGRVRGNKMTHLSAVSDKLRGRAVRIVMDLTGVDFGSARKLLRETDGCVHTAVDRALNVKRP
ncbi:MAG: N-acetylmuramic acid 6-phosphate etherase [Deltaproteobacteria bacterium]|nr:N-acetylmuramic acid 6-phosphate etherase [Deltaproteobacteria bacterium]